MLSRTGFARTSCNIQCKYLLFNDVKYYIIEINQGYGVGCSIFMVFYLIYLFLVATMPSFQTRGRSFESPLHPHERVVVVGIYIYLMIGKILGFWLVNWHMIWSCINLSESYINLPVFVCMYVCSFLLPMQRSRRQSWDKFVINCFGVWYNLYLAIRGLYHPRLRLGWYSPLIARYKLYHTPKQLITNIVA